MELDLAGARAFFRSSPFMVDLGVEPVAVSPGRMSTVLTIQPRLLQYTGQVHAGVLATLADHSMGAAAQTLADPGFWVLSAELKTSLLRPAVGERLVCEAHVLRRGRSISFTEAEVYTEGPAGRTLVMKASATMALVAAKD